MYWFRLARLTLASIFVASASLGTLVFPKEASSSDLCGISEVYLPDSAFVLDHIRGDSRMGDPIDIKVYTGLHFSNSTNEVRFVTHAIISERHSSNTMYYGNDLGGSVISQALLFREQGCRFAGFDNRPVPNQPDQDLITYGFVQRYVSNPGETRWIQESDGIIREASCVGLQGGRYTSCSIKYNPVVSIWRQAPPVF